MENQDHEALVQMHEGLIRLNASVKRLNKKYLALSLLLVDKNITSWEEMDDYDTKAEAWIAGNIARLKRLDRPGIPKPSKESN